jgi:hypothetical protein
MDRKTSICDEIIRNMINVKFRSVDIHSFSDKAGLTKVPEFKTKIFDFRTSPEEKHREETVSIRLGNTDKALRWLFRKQWLKSVTKPCNLQLANLDDCCNRVVVYGTEFLVDFYWSTARMLIIPRSRWVGVRGTTKKDRSISHTHKTGGGFVGYYHGVSLCDDEQFTTRTTIHKYKSIVYLLTDIEGMNVISYDFGESEEFAFHMESVLKQGLKEVS